MEYRDANQNFIGRTLTQGIITYLHDASGNLLASYNSETNLTTSASGGQVVRENQLLTFLKPHKS